MTSVKQDQLFAEEMSGQAEEVKMKHSTLDVAIDWIQDNLSPEDVFDTKDLQTWAENNGYVKE
jgi:hypothetical protein